MYYNQKYSKNYITSYSELKHLKSILAYTNMYNTFINVEYPINCEYTSTNFYRNI